MKVKESSHVLCVHCKVTMKIEDKEKHLGGKKHKKNVKKEVDAGTYDPVASLISVADPDTSPAPPPPPPPVAVCPVVVPEEEEEDEEEWDEEEYDEEDEYTEDDEESEDEGPVQSPNSDTYEVLSINSHTPTFYSDSNPKPEK